MRTKKLSVRLVYCGSHAHSCCSSHIRSEASIVDPHNRWNLQHRPRRCEPTSDPETHAILICRDIEGAQEISGGLAGWLVGLVTNTNSEAATISFSKLHERFARHPRKGLSILADDDGPLLISRLICGATLTALRKEYDVFRPIAVGEKSRYLFSSMLPTRNGELTRGLLTPHRSGVETPGGCEEWHMNTDKKNG